MKPLRFSLFLLTLLSFLLMAGCTSLSYQSRGSAGSKSYESLTSKDPATLNDREKWSLARKAYSRAESERNRGDNDAAAYYYEMALELLGSLDLASIDLETQRVLTFNRRVLESYDDFVASIKRLPPNAGLTALLEAGTDEPTEIEIEPLHPESDVDSIPPMVLNHDPLPGVPMEINSQVRGQINFFMGKGRSVMMRWMERSAEVFPRLRPILREEGIPEEVLYLSMIESGLNLQAYSYAKASGLWQFIPSTGRIYGLNVDRVYDERRHVELSTRAACQYLRKLYEQFGDWYLAFAAYNCGEGRVERELKRSHTKDYWRLKRLPRQTRSYVPIYLAARAICENPERYDFPSLPAETPFECHREFVYGPYKLDDIAKAAGVDPLDVRALNPEFMQGVVPKTGEPFMVRMPTRPKENFAAVLQEMPKTDVQPTTSHRVRRGETLGSIARKYGTSVRAIQSQPENRRINPRKMRVGQEVIVPVPSYYHASSQAALRGDYETTSNGGQIVYTVHRGETLGRIGTQLGVSVDQICRENGITNPNQIKPGQKLHITVKGQPTYASKLSGEMRYHTVRSGDTVWSIAQHYQINQKSIIDWNRLSRSGRIYPGQKLIVSQ